MLTPTQAQTLKAYILADPVLSAFPHTQDGAYAIAEALKATQTVSIRPIRNPQGRLEGAVQIKADGSEVPVTIQ